MAINPYTTNMPNNNFDFNFKTNLPSLSFDFSSLKLPNINNNPLPELSNITFPTFASNLPNINLSTNNLNDVFATPKFEPFNFTGNTLTDYSKAMQEILKLTVATGNIGLDLAVNTAMANYNIATINSMSARLTLGM